MKESINLKIILPTERTKSSGSQESQSLQARSRLATELKEKGGTEQGTGKQQDKTGKVEADIPN